MTDSIVAIATPLGKAGISIVRVSGKESFDITIQNTGKIVHSTDELDSEVIGKGLLHEPEAE